MKNFQLCFTLAVGLALLCASTGSAATRTATTSGNWNNNATWGGNPFPVAGDIATIPGGLTVTIASSRTEACATFNLNTTSVANSGSLNFTDATSALNVSGTATIGTANNGTGGTISISVDAGTFTCSALTFSDNGRDLGQLRISTGSATVTNNLTMVGSATRSTISFTGAGTLNVGGTFSGGGSIATATGCTVNYNGAAQTIFAATYANLTLSGSGAKTTTGATVNGVLAMEGTATTTGTVATYGASATLKYNGGAAQTTGTEFPATWGGSGGVIIANTAGAVTLGAAKTISASLTINSGAALDTSIGNNFALNVGGSWTNSGTFQPRAGTVTFNGSSGTQTLAGTTTFYNLTLNNSGATTSFGSSLITISNSLATSAGTMSGGTSTITFAGTSGTISGANSKLFYNLVINTGASIVNSSGGNTTISGNFTNSGTFSQSSGQTTTFDNTGTHNLGGGGTTTFGSVAIQGSATVNAGVHNFSVAGNWSLTSGGLFNPGAATVTFSGAAAQFIGGTGSTTFSNLSIANTSAAVTNVTGFSASGTVALSSSAVLNLVAAGSANNLTIAGVAKASGTWGATGSGAGHPDNTHFLGTGKLTVSTGPASSTAVSSAVNPSVYGQSGVTFTATVSGTGPTPTGTVQFKTNGVNFGSAVSLSAGSAASGALPGTTAANNYSVTADYSGNDNFGLSTSSTLTQTINRAGTANATVSSSNPVLPGANVTFTTTLIAIAPGAGTPTGSVTFKDGTNTLGAGVLNGSAVATKTTNNLSHGAHVISAEYAGDGNFTGSTNTLNQTNNTPPAASNAAFVRAPGLSFKIKISDLIVTNTSDADGDTNKLLSLGGSGQGATITTNASFIFYLPSTGASSNNNDSFTYTVKDGFGGTATASITINVVTATGAAQNLTVSGGSVTVHCAGIPGYPYLLQRSTNLVAWTTLLNTNAPGAGLFIFTDNFSDLGGPPASAYYRTAQP